LIATGCILSLPGSRAQQWHSDGDHLAADAQLPPHCLNVSRQRPRARAPVLVRAPTHADGRPKPGAEDLF
jgi:hypothetical protein